jgi:hypothetical protein
MSPRWGSTPRLTDLLTDCQSQRDFDLTCTAFRPVLELTQPRIQRKQGAFTLWVKRPGREADHPLPSSAEVKNGGAIISAQPDVFIE